MDAQEIRTLLGKSIFERAQKYRKRILQSSCTTNEDGVRHLTALVQGSGPDCYYTQVWLRENGICSACFLRKHPHCGVASWLSTGQRKSTRKRLRVPTHRQEGVQVPSLF